MLPMYDMINFSESGQRISLGAPIGLYSLLV